MSKWKEKVTHRKMICDECNLPIIRGDIRFTTRDYFSVYTQRIENGIEYKDNVKRCNLTYNLHPKCFHLQISAWEKTKTPSFWQGGDIKR